jgi:hypothetical protein
MEEIVMESFDDSNAEVPIEPTEDLTIADVDATENDQLRQERITEYAAQALSKESVLESNLASINCGLLKIAYWLEQSIGEATTKLPMTPERKQSVYRAIDTHLRVARRLTASHRLSFVPRIRANWGQKRQSASRQSAILLLEPLGRQAKI